VEVLELAHQRLNRTLDEEIQSALLNNVNSEAVVQRVHRFAKLYPLLRRHQDGIRKLSALTREQLKQHASSAASPNGDAKSSAAPGTSPPPRLILAMPSPLPHGEFPDPLLLPLVCPFLCCR
jgi:hypothetical protein